MTKALMPGVAGYKKKYLRKDIIAALVVTAIAVPESLGFAAIIGLPPVTGLYTALLAPIVFALFARTRHLVVGADSATAVLVASGAVLVAQAGTAAYAGAVFVLGILTAIMLLLMAVARFDFIADLISRPVLLGFLAGVGLQLMAMQLPAMAGVAVQGDLMQRLVATFSQIQSWNGMALTLTVMVVGVMVITRQTRFPGALAAIVAASLLAVVFDMARYGVKFIDAFPAGLPSIALPSDDLLGMIGPLLPVAFSIALVIVAQSAVTIRANVSQRDGTTHLERDILALGLANAASALTQGFSVNGSPPRTAAALGAGGQSQLVNVIMGLFIALLLLFGSAFFAYLPYPALAAMVFVVGLYLVRVRELRYLWGVHRTEFVIAIVAMLGVALIGVIQGILIAVIVSLMERLMRQYRPKDHILLRDGKLSDWAGARIDKQYHSEKYLHGVLIYRFDSSLFFENAEYFAARIKTVMQQAKKPVQYLLIDAGAIDDIDYTAVERIKSLHKQFEQGGVHMGFAHVSPNLRNELDRYGVTNTLGEDHIYETLDHAVKSHRSVEVS